jgi:hypothetical protein
MLELTIHRLSGRALEEVSGSQTPPPPPLSYGLVLWQVKKKYGLEYGRKL